jgi:hypothetical protein
MKIHDVFADAQGRLVNIRRLYGNDPQSLVEYIYRDGDARLHVSKQADFLERHVWVDYFGPIIHNEGSK